MDKRLIRRQIGATSLSLPQLGFGSAHIGGMRARVPDAEARGALQAAWDGGIRYYDTAPFYALGLSEQRLGNFLLNQPRDEFILSTKIGRVLHRPKDPKTFDRGGWVGGLNFEIEWDYSYDGVMRSYEQSLVRMGLDTIDALLVHDLDASGHGEHFEARIKALEATGMKALEELKRNGDIKAIGMGINSEVSLATVATRVKLDFVLVAMPYTLVDQSVLHTGFEYCRREGMSVIIGAPFASGILVTGSGPGRPLSLPRGARGNPGEGARHRGGLPRPWRAARRGGVAVSGCASSRRLDHPRRRERARNAGQHRRLRSANSLRVLGGFEVARAHRLLPRLSPRKRAVRESVLRAGLTHVSVWDRRSTDGTRDQGGNEGVGA